MSTKLNKFSRFRSVNNVKMDNTEIPIFRNTDSNGLTTVNVSNLSENIVDFAKCASRLIIPPRSTGFIKLSIPHNEKLLGDKMVHFEQLDHITENMDEFGDNIGPGKLFKLQPGVIKIKLSGNKKIYTHIPYSNISDETIILKKGNTLGVLSLVDEVIVAAGPSRQVDNNNESPAADQGVKTSEFQATANTAEATEEKCKIGYIDEMQKDYSDPVTRHEYIIKLLLFIEATKKGKIVVIRATKTLTMEITKSLRCTTARWQPSAVPSKHQQTQLSPKYISNGTASTLINAQRSYKPFADASSYVNYLPHGQEEIPYYVFFI